MEDVSGPQSDYEELLVLRASPPRERADAARNRAAVLAAAARLFREQGVDRVSMDAVAAEAGVGKGTLFRRFGDKAGLGAALLDERERELQEAIIYGKAPLGPGTPGEKVKPAKRIVAFFDAYLDYVLAHLEVSRVSENAAPGARYRIGAYRFWHRHLTILLRQATPKADAEALAHTLLSAVAAEHLIAIVAELGAQRVRASIIYLVESACG